MDKVWPETQSEHTPVTSLPAPLVLVALLWYFPALMDAGTLCG
jgi:hypothetical protein